ncbi:MAG TPA: iron-sulfur cluster assembly scaffold protein [Planctomycetota bacterium]|jgi:NifU-like protein
MPTFSAKVMDHFQHPRHLGVISDSDVQAGERLVFGDAGLITHGDGLRLSLRVRVNDQTVLDARFQNFGSPAPIASSSYLCETIIGKTLPASLAVSVKQLDRELEGLPELRNRQPVLVLIALDNAARQFRGQPPRNQGAAGEPPVCNCFHVPESVIERAIRLQRLKTVEDVTVATKACGGCQTCAPDIEIILEHCERREYKFHIPPEDYEAAERLYGVPPPSAEELAHNPPPPPPRSQAVAPDGFVYPRHSPVETLVASHTLPRGATRSWTLLSYAERLQRIEELFEKELRPAIVRDGGDIRLLALKGNRVLVSLHGHCENCPSAPGTLKKGVERRLQQALCPELEVVETVAVGGVVSSAPLVTRHSSPVTTGGKAETKGADE